MCITVCLFSFNGFQPNRTSEVFGFLLNSLQYEGKLASRKACYFNQLIFIQHSMFVLIGPFQAYVSHVNSYIEALGIQCVRHMKVMNYS